MKRVISLFFVLMFISLVSAVPQDLTVNGRLTNSSGSALEGSYSVVFSLYDVYSGGTALYSSTQTVSTNAQGVYSAILPDVDLNFSDNYYLGIKVGSDDEMTPRLNVTSSPYALRAGNVSSSGIEFDSNVNMTDKNITTTGTGFFGWLGSLTDRINKLFVDEINATGNIATDGNVSADYFIGDGSQLTGISGDNSSWNESYANSKYILQDSEDELNVNSSIWWASVSGWISEWFVQEGNNLNFNESKLNETIDLRTTSGLWTNSSGDIYYNDGNVGIGTTTPTEKLDVNGGVNIWLG